MKTVFIKNMVCDRCKMVVNQTTEKLGLHAIKTELGEVTFEKDLNTEQLQQLDVALLALGFERIDDRKGRLVEAVKKKVLELIRHSNLSDRKFNWSHLLSEELHYDYNYISNLFSSVEGITLEHYIIAQKIERVKELLFYDELTLGEIAQRLGYSSIAHLSAQFKKVTGFTPTELKKSRDQNHRKPLDKIS
jgi:AraC-like DNA-binding protein